MFLNSNHLLLFQIKQHFPLYVLNSLLLISITFSPGYFVPASCATTTKECLLWILVTTICLQMERTIWFSEIFSPVLNKVIQITEVTFPLLLRYALNTKFFRYRWQKLSCPQVIVKLKLQMALNINSFFHHHISSTALSNGADLC